MIRSRHTVSTYLGTLGVFVGLLVVTSIPTATHAAEARTLMWKMDNLNLAKQLWLDGDVSVVPAVDQAIYLANRSINRGDTFSVTYKTEIPTGLTPHDFFSTGAYWWPNPDTEDGLPWIPIDGVINPDSGHDFVQLGSVASDVQALSLAYFFTEDTTYSDWAANLLRIYFLNPDTYMKPEVRYGSALPGISNGGFSVAGVGNQFRRIFDPIALLEGSPSWTATDKAGMQQWASDFRDFMHNDPVGLEKQFYNDNHGTNYDMISALLALYLDDDAGAREWILHYKDRIDLQFTPDGTQLSPSNRADSQYYHEYNLRIATDIAEMADRYEDIDLWSYEAEDGGGMVNSIEFLIPYFTGQQPWDLWPTASTFTPKYWTWYRMWLRAAANLDDPTYLSYADMARAYDPSGYDYDPINILYPLKVSALPGDLNADGFVGIEDLNIVLAQWNTDAAGDLRADINGDGFVGIDDLNAVLSGWNDSTPPSAIVPEPASGILLLSGLFLGTRRRARRAIA
jgi:hypothetical protein